MSKHTSQAQSAPYTNVCLRSATNKSATSARARAQPQQMGEAPVKYELTGASQPLANRSSRCGVDQLYASGDSLARGYAAFFSSLACHAELTACRDN
jgi:hypothetical protein